MTKTTQAVRGGLLAAVALLTVSAAPAQAVPQKAVGGNWLYLTVTTGDARSSDTRGTLLLCDPPQGHAHAAQACEELRAAEGDITRIPVRADVLCPMIYAPVTASARGEWNGRRTEYTHTFSNTCMMGVETGSVFALGG
ncbi:subtilase-type protease inhibitor [Streptomyces sp. NBC_01356]|uniref:SSI family serine proteinase inhibitor n=1 Tax=Streptomyces sp. NBC_01356 TaxID=2903836 RepID=UPI002E34FA69|nr:SSI family serine proteinase inhibitor [Streptomyces sp. NBC_01356]